MTLGITKNFNFWSEQFWLPENQTWEGVKTPIFTDFQYGIFASIVLTIMRIFLCNYVFTPLGLGYGLRYEHAKQVPYNPKFEEYYLTNKRPSSSDIKSLSKKLDMSEVKVSNWFRMKRNSAKFPIIVKFVESGWKFSFYYCIFCYGIYCLHREPFLYDSTYFFRDYPHHDISQCIFWYYTIELSYYVTEFMWIFVEVKRKDFAVMLSHHVFTVTLIVFSFLTNYFRIGSVIMLIHDASDFWLEAAKMFRYVGKFWPCMFCFTTFILVWIVTRLYYFPVRVMSSIVLVAPGQIGYYPALNGFLIFLCGLQMLHIFWTIQIIRTAMKPFTTGQLSSDARSDSEMSELESEHPNGVYMNGNAKKF